MGEAPDSLNGSIPPAAWPPTDPSDGFSANKALGAWMQEIAPYGVFTTDRTLRIRSWNQWLVHHSGLAATDVIGRSLGEMFPELEHRHLLPRFKRALAGEISVLSAALHKHLLPFPVTVPESGLPHMLQTVRIAPLPEDGRVAGTITLIEDVTQREFHASSLSRQQELDRLLSASLAILLQSENPAQEMAGIFASIMPTLGIDAYVSYLLSGDGLSLVLKESAGILPKQRQAIETLQITDEERRLLRAPEAVEGVKLAAHRDALAQLGVPSHYTFPLGVSDRFLGLVSFASYQTGRVSPADVQILARITRYVAIALDRAARERDVAAASRAKDDFLAALSHELRTPLNPVLLLASDSVANPAFSEDARDAFRVIEKNVLLEARLIDDLLDLTRIERGKLNMEFKSIDVHLILRDALVTVRAETVQKNIVIETELAAERSMVEGDSGRLQQVLWNVLRNAVKFTPNGGHIRVVTRNTAGGQIALEVTDTGLGMEPHELGRIFAAFSQGDHAGQSAHRFGGLGLGLAISKRLVELHAGRIEATSKGRNQGATFVVHLPLNSAVRTAVASPVDRSRAAASDRPLVVHGKILLVEDHEPTRATLERLLASRGYEVVGAASADAAKTEAGKQFFDLVLSDVGLPDSDGYELMKTLHARHGLKGIALTGYGMEDDVVRSRAAGFLSHLTKPISISSLETALAAALRQAGASRRGADSV